MDDYIVRGLTDNENIRCFAAITTNMVEKARQIHNTSPVATAAMGRTLTAAVIMGSMLKGEKDTITIQIKGRGEMGGVVAISDSNANVRGYVHNPTVELPLNDKGKLDVSGAIGPGYLNVIKDIGLKEPYIGQVPLVSGEIGEDLAYYYVKSEQTNSVVGLGVLIERDYTVDIAGGFIIQAMPGADENVIKILEDNISKINSVTNLFKEYKTPEEILKHIFDSIDITITEKVPTNYFCTCTKERVEKALISMGEAELSSIIEEKGEAELSCHFCDKKYHFNKEDLISLLEQSKK